MRDALLGCGDDKPYAGDIEAWDVRPEVGNVWNNRPDLMERAIGHCSNTLATSSVLRHSFSAMPKPEDLRPMSEFDPSRQALVYDQLNDETFEWLPARHGVDYMRYAPKTLKDGIVAWDGLLLAGWRPLPKETSGS